MIECRPVKLADNQHVVESFLKEQWAETGDKDLPCEPNWSVYHGLEKSGSLLLLMVYELYPRAVHEKPIGYLAAFVHPHMNSVSSKVASIPTYYVAPRPIGRALIMRNMLKYAIDLLRARGVVHVNADTEYEHSAGRLLTRLGFRPAKIGYKLPLA